MCAVTRIIDQVRARATALFHSFWTPTPDTMRRWAVVAVAVNVLITVTGATVRVTGSGLGCPTWPRCTPDSFTPVPHPDVSVVNMLIEFGNRTLTGLVGAVAVVCVLAALRLRERRRDLVHLAWLQVAGVLLQALWGGVVVQTLLNPVTVNLHFLFSIGLIAAAYALYARSVEGDGAPQRLVHRDIRTLGFVLVAAVLVLIVAGMVVTGTGPHSGDELAGRFPFDIETVARIHADTVWIVIGLTFSLLFALHVTDAPGRARRAALVLFGVELAQGVIGYVQYFTAVPAALVAAHVLGATLVWIATLRVVYMMRSRGPLGTPAPPRETDDERTPLSASA
ncbi:COX15/CtaA family protein [Thermocatellispora tengchongensis]|uniref:COX15/CtaA family protein n=1 Tax=Thermocatellispora tengchongensis TaxID=1073253 RepID=UPI0016171C8D|nr:COX15/CtaA family protein [Thermocatellispora tengchongensis]